MKAKKARAKEDEDTAADMESDLADEQISSIHFKERPGESPYNASEVVSIADSRFLFCDNNISDAAFDDLKKAFPMSMMQPASRGGFGLLAVVAAPPPLRVHDVGLFEASFVPTLADFERLDPRFRLSPGVWEQLPQYRDWGFAVFKLKKIRSVGLGSRMTLSRRFGGCNSRGPRPLRACPNSVKRNGGRPPGSWEMSKRAHG